MLTRFAAALVAGCALIGPANAKGFEAKLANNQQIGSWALM
jgi:hypothetical protein